jgi:hypothetical protein
MSKQPVPRALKPITAFIRRAEEHDTKEGDAHRVVAYYCREYAAELGFKLVQRNGSSSPEVDSYLGGVIDKLLAEKEEIKALATREEAKVVILDVALPGLFLSLGGLSKPNSIRAYVQNLQIIYL